MKCKKTIILCLVGVLGIGLLFGLNTYYITKDVSYSKLCEMGSTNLAADVYILNYKSHEYLVALNYLGGVAIIEVKK